MSHFSNTSFHSEENGADLPLISIVVPSYNEELNLDKLYEVLSGYLDRLNNYRWELLIVDDGSKDSSRSILETIHYKDPRVKAISFSRNFGNQMAISAGLELARGDAVIVMDADLQQPPEIIEKLLDLWRAGYHVVNTKKTYGQEIGLLKRLSSDLFYKVMNNLAEVRIEKGVSDFRLMDRKVVNVLNNMPEHSRFIRAQVAWLGFRQTTVSFTANKRNAGVPSFSFIKLLSLAINGIISSSVRPLRFITLSGIFMFLLVIPYGLWALFQFFFLGPKTPGWTSLIIVEMFLGGSMLVSLGIVGEYIARIYEEVKKRPRYIIERSFGIDPNENNSSFCNKTPRINNNPDGDNFNTDPVNVPDQPLKKSDSEQ